MQKGSTELDRIEHFIQADAVLEALKMAELHSQRKQPQRSSGSFCLGRHSQYNVMYVGQTCVQDMCDYLRHQHKTDLLLADAADQMQR